MIEETCQDCANRGIGKVSGVLLLLPQADTDTAAGRILPGLKWPGPGADNKKPQAVSRLRRHIGDDVL